MPKGAKKRAARKTELQLLTGRSQIAAFLGEPTSVVQRWSIGKECRFVAKAAKSRPHPTRAARSRLAECGLLVGFPQHNYVRSVVRAHHSQCLTVRRPAESGDQVRSEICDLVAW
jgi:hypothetical protein